MIENILQLDLKLLIYFVGVFIVGGFIVNYLSNKVNAEINSITNGIYMRIYDFFAVIGTPIHEFGHYIMCKIFGLKVVEVKWYIPKYKRVGNTLGYVKWSRVNNLKGRIGTFFVGIGPLIVGGIVIYILSLIMLPEFWSNISHYSSKSLDYNIFQICIKSLFDFDVILTIKFWIFLYIAISISLHMGLSDADVNGAREGIIHIVGIGTIISIILSILRVNVEKLFVLLKVYNLIMILLFSMSIIFLLSMWLIIKIISNATDINKIRSGYENIKYVSEEIKDTTINLANSAGNIYSKINEKINNNDNNNSNNNSNNINSGKEKFCKFSVLFNRFKEAISSKTIIKYFCLAIIILLIFFIGIKVYSNRERERLSYKEIETRVSKIESYKEYFDEYKVINEEKKEKNKYYYEIKATKKYSNYSKEIIICLDTTYSNRAKKWFITIKETKNERTYPTKEMTSQELFEIMYNKKVICDNKALKFDKENVLNLSITDKCIDLKDNRAEYTLKYEETKLNYKRNLELRVKCQFSNGWSVSSIDRINNDKNSITMLSFEDGDAYNALVGEEIKGENNTITIDNDTFSKLSIIKRNTDLDEQKSSYTFKYYDDGLVMKREVTFLVNYKVGYNGWEVDNISVFSDNMDLAIAK